MNTVEIQLPPLRERPSDIHLVFRKFAADFASKYHLPPLRLDDEAVRLLEQYRWPGNIRQLRDLAEQMSVIEKTRLVGKDILKTYLPQVDASNLPALGSISRVSGINDYSYSKEREALYKLLFEMKAEINALKESAATEEGLQEKIHSDFSTHSHELSSPSSVGLRR